MYIIRIPSRYHLLSFRTTTDIVYFMHQVLLTFAESKSLHVFICFELLVVIRFVAHALWRHPSHNKIYR